MSYGTRLPIEEPEEQRRLAKFLPKITNIDQFAREIVEISLWLHAALGTDKTPSAPELTVSADRTDTRKKLLLTAKRLGAARKSFQNLDQETQNFLRGVAAMMQERSSSSDISAMEDFLKQLEFWERSAGHLSQQYVGKSSYLKTTAPRAAIESLKELWIDQSGVKPTLITPSRFKPGPQVTKKSGPFLDFCEQVICPVYVAHSMDCPSLQNLIQVALNTKESST